MITGRMMFNDIEEERANKKVDNGLVNIIKGSDEYFVLLVAGNKSFAKSYINWFGFMIDATF